VDAQHPALRVQLADEELFHGGGVTGMPVVTEQPPDEELE
jgi:hypothetical protein